MNGYALCHASDRLQDDETVVQAAITKSGRSVLDYASYRLQDEFGWELYESYDDGSEDGSDDDY